MAFEVIFQSDAERFMTACRIEATFAKQPMFAAGALAAFVQRDSTDLWFVLTPPRYCAPLEPGPWAAGNLSFWIALGAVPKVGAAALFRKLLSLNAEMIGPRFTLSEPNNMLWLVEYPSLRRKRDNTFAEEIPPGVAPALDVFIAEYRASAPDLIKEFGLQQQASQ